MKRTLLEAAKGYKDEALNHKVWKGDGSEADETITDAIIGEMPKYERLVEAVQRWVDTQPEPTNEYVTEADVALIEAFDRFERTVGVEGEE